MATLALVGIATLASSTAATGSAIAAGTFGAAALNFGAAVVGSIIDGQLAKGGNTTTTRQGAAKLDDIKISSSSEGANIKRIFGNGRAEGNLIWSSKFKEKINSTAVTEPGGKFDPNKTTITVDHEYSVSCTFAFAEQYAPEGGDLFDTRLPKIKEYWINGKIYKKADLDKLCSKPVEEIIGNDDAGLNTTMHRIEKYKTDGEDDTRVPQYNGIFHVVFTDLKLKDFGNRIPQVNILLENPVLIRERHVNGFNIVPNGEIGYATTPQIFEKDSVIRPFNPSNTNTESSNTDLVQSISSIPRFITASAGENAVNKHFNLTIPWFGSSLNARNCFIEPKVESADFESFPHPWGVAGRTRADVQVVTRGGGTPSDVSVVEAMKLLAFSIGISETDGGYATVSFMPEIIMDIDGYPDKSGIAITDASIAETISQVFFRTNISPVNDFEVTDNGTDAPLRYTVKYTGNQADKDSYAAFIYHYAHLFGANSRDLTYPRQFAQFYVGSGLTKLLQSQDTQGNYVSVDNMKIIVNNVLVIFRDYGLSHIGVGYAADWKDYQAHRPDENTLTYHLDPLWEVCDFIGINWNAPISDWRDGNSHKDFTGVDDTFNFAKGESINDFAYLKDQVFRGEGFDYYYATQEDRLAQIRTPYSSISGVAPMVKHKDLLGFKTKPHQNYKNGVPSGTATNNISTKFILISSFGCYAVDKGTNEPDNPLPIDSTGAQDNYAQRIYAEAITEAFTEKTALGIGLSRMFASDWSAKPFELLLSDVDYKKSRLLNGRLFITELGELIAEICSWAGIHRSEIDVSRLVGSTIDVDGFVVDNNVSPREALTVLSDVYLFDACESGGKLVFKFRSDTQFTDIELNELVVSGGEASTYSITRSQASELPAEARLTYVGIENSYQIESMGSRKNIGGESRGAFEKRAPISFTRDKARTISQILLQQQWSACEQARFRLPPNKIFLDNGDGISISLKGRKKNLRIVEMQNQGVLSINSETHDPSIYTSVIEGGDVLPPLKTFPVYARTTGVIMDIPTISGDELKQYAPRIVAYQRPFPPSVVWFQEDADGFLTPRGLNTVPTSIGVLTEALPRGAVNIMDRVSNVYLDWFGDELLSVPLDRMLRDPYSNLIAVRTSNTGLWELIKFCDAEYLGDGRYKLSNLIRGINGSYQSMVNYIPPGQSVVLVNRPLNPLDLVGNQYSEKDYVYGASLLPVGSPFFKEESFTATGVGVKPLPPVHIRFGETNSGVRVFWQGQTQYGAESIELADNSDLRYLIDIRNESGSLVVNQSSLNIPNYTFTSAPSYFRVDIRTRGDVLNSEPLTAIYDRR